MQHSEIRDRIRKAMASFWWTPDSFVVVERPELAYCKDSNGGFNHVARIDDLHPNLEGLISEISTFFQGCDTSVITFDDQSPKLFSLLEQAGFTKGFSHDICYRKVSSHIPTVNALIQTRIVQSIPDLISVEKVSSQAFGKDFSLRPESEYAHMLKEYLASKPRAIRVLANSLEGDVLGAGGMGIFDDLGVGTFFGGGTIPSARKQGVYTALIDQRMAYAAQRGLDIIGIYARHGTSAPIVAAQGFESCGVMTQWNRGSS